MHRGKSQLERVGGLDVKFHLYRGIFSHSFSETGKAVEGILEFKY